MECIHTDIVVFLSLLSQVHVNLLFPNVLPQAITILPNSYL